MVSFDYQIRESMGLHARPAGQIVRMLKSCPCKVVISCGDRSVDAKKLFAVMGMAVKCGDIVTVTFDGEEEQSACEKTKAFFDQNF